MSTKREQLKNKKRIVVKIGSSTITHEETNSLDFMKLERLVRVLTDLKNQGKEVVLVSSGAIAVGRKTVGLQQRPEKISLRQACAAVGQARLMMVYQKLFAEYNQVPAQILMTKYTMINEISRKNAQNTFRELLGLGVIPIVNENDTVTTDEVEFGDNDTLSAIVAALIGADMLILMSDIDGLYTDDPNKNPDARFIEEVNEITDDMDQMAKGSASSVGTGGMSTKLSVPRIAVDAGADMVTFHLEATNQPQECIDLIHSLGCKAGISIKPGTAVEEVLPYLDSVDMVLIMTVEPGFGGQSYIEACTDKIRGVRALITARGVQVDVQVDGGIDQKNVEKVIEAGANILVAGSSVFRGDVESNVIALMGHFPEDLQ